MLIRSARICTVFSVLTAASLLWVPGKHAAGQVRVFPHREAFDSAATLPPGWSSTSNRRPLENDAAISTSTPHSPPHCVVITNATIGQALTGPLMVFPDRTCPGISFVTRRSASFGAVVALEVSADSGTSYRSVLALRPSGSTAYTSASALVDSCSGPLVLRWRVMPDSTGSSGTFRLDDVMILARPLFDAALGIVRAVSGLLPPALAVEVLVKNTGCRPIGTFTVDAFADTNRDGQAQDAERLSSVVGGPLAPGDSSYHLLECTCVSRGPVRLILLVRCPDDGDPGNDRAEITLPQGSGRPRVVVNEIMFAPTGDEPEWVELLNAGSDSVSLLRWSISDATVASKHALGRAVTIAPDGGYVVLCKDSAVLAECRPLVGGRVIPVAGFPSLNNAGDAVVLFDEGGRTVDSVAYLPQWAAGPGVSLERVDPLDTTSSAANWRPCVDPSGATPGGPNSVRRLDHDLSAGTLSANVIPGAGMAALSVTVRNAGRLTAEAFSTHFLDRRGDEDLVQLGVVAAPGSIPPGDSVVVTWEWSDPPPGLHRVEACVDDNLDGRASNNTVAQTVWIPFARGPLCLSEIMAAPFPGDAEFIEVVNTGDRALDLRDWSAAGRALAQGVSIVTIPPGGYAVIASDSAIFRRFPWLSSSGTPSRIAGTSLGLNNDADTVVVRDREGVPSDSLRYESSWHNPLVADRSGRSLERISFRGAGAEKKNWSTCLSAAGGTPGMPNSILARQSVPHSRLAADPNPFSPDADGHDDFTLLHFELPDGVDAVNVTIFDARGRTIRHLASCQPVAAAGVLVWDGLDDRRRSLPVGPYIVLFEGSGRNAGWSARCVVVLARRL